MLCGDEVNAVVCDIGTSTCKFGAAGESTPKHVFRSEIGVVSESRQLKIYGDTGFRFLRENMEITSLRANSASKIEDAAGLISHGIEKCMKLKSCDYPLVLTESSFINNVKEKYQMVESCFETVGSPGLFMASSGTLSAFSTGRPTGVVIDWGAAGTRIIPVVDGYAMKKSTIITNRGGNFFDSLIEQEVTKKLKNPIKLWYETKSTSTSHGITKSFHDMHFRDIIKDIKTWMCYIPHVPIPTTTDRNIYLQDLGLIPPPYELPDGTKVFSSEKLCTTPESLFFPSHLDDMNEKIGDNNLMEKKEKKYELTALETNLPTKRKRARDILDNDLRLMTSNPTTNMNTLTKSKGISRDYNVDQESISDLIYLAVARCDVDVRRDLLSNIVLGGGGAQLEGVMQRLSYELNEIVPSHLKVKIIPSSNLEKKFSSWIGGSILSICGSFQQLWFSKAEYEEHGVERCKRKFDH